MAAGESPAGDLESETKAYAIVASDLVELHSYWNPSAGDNALSSNRIGPPGYVRYRTEGKIGRPDMAQPPGTVPLFTWYKPGAADYFSTTNPAWSGRPGDVRGGYNFVRVEGYVFTSNVAGSTELELWFDPSREDNFTTADPNWTRDSSGRRSPSYQRVRPEGFILRSGATLPPVQAFHHGTMGGGPRGERDLLLIQAGYRGAPFRHGAADLDRLTFGPGFPNLRDYMSEVSNGNFTWRRGASWRVELPDDPDTAADEGNYQHAFAADEPIMAFALIDVPAPGPAGEVMRIAAENGGGAGTLLLTGMGEWETFNLADENGGTLISGDIVAFKTYNGRFLRETAGRLTADAPTRAFLHARFQATKVGGGLIRAGDRIQLRSLATSRFIRQSAAGVDVLGAASEAASMLTLRKNWPSHSHQARAAVEAVARAGFTFASFDKNADGVVSADEAALLVINSAPSPAYGGANRHVGALAIPGSSLQLASRPVVMIGEGASLMTMAHELLHSLGAVDLYGAAGLSQDLTLMGATAWVAEDVRSVFHLDPWHKLRLGWTGARIVAVNGAGDSTSALAVSSSEGADKSPLLIYDPRRYDTQARRGEYFLVEHRTRTLTLKPQHYDANTTGTGIAVWSVQTDESGNPLVVPAVTGAGWDATVFSFGAPDGSRGGNTVWTDANGVVTLRYRDGTDAGVRLKIGPIAVGSSLQYLDWSPTGTVRPRLDESDSIAFGTTPFRLDGAFPAASPGVEAWIRPVGIGSPIRLSISNYTTTRLLLSRPSGVSLGSYDLWVEKDGQRSNPLPISIR